MPPSGMTGTGSHATRVACALETTVTTRKSSMSPMDTSITVSATFAQGAT